MFGAGKEDTGLPVPAVPVGILDVLLVRGKGALLSGAVLEMPVSCGPEVDAMDVPRDPGTPVGDATSVLFVDG